MSTEAIVLILVGVLLVVFAFYRQYKEKMHLKDELNAARNRVYEATLVADDRPFCPKGVDHKWAKKPFEEYKGFSRTRCLNCPAILEESGSAKRFG